MRVSLFRAELKPKTPGLLLATVGAVFECTQLPLRIYSAPFRNLFLGHTCFGLRLMSAFALPPDLLFVRLSGLLVPGVSSGGSLQGWQRLCGPAGPRRHGRGVRAADARRRQESRRCLRRCSENSRWR
eukprot:6189092-Pleurochrysis_carterae.AAC.6